MTLKEPIVEGAYYRQGLTGPILGPAVEAKQALVPHFVLSGKEFRPSGEPLSYGRYVALTERVYLVPTDPAEVVAELRRRSSECEPPGEVYGEEANFQSGRSDAFDASAAAVESMLGLARCGEGCDGNCELTTSGPTKAEAEIAELRLKAVEVIAELRAEVADLARHNFSNYIRDRSEALTHAADLVAEKLLTAPPKPPESA